MADKEYIERGALLESIKRVYCTDCNSYNGVRCRACGTGDALDIIEDAPAASVAPRAEVAREIFEEIEKIIKSPFAVGFCMTAPSFRQAISDYNEGIRKEILYYIANLKEKYADAEAEPPEGD